MWIDILNTKKKTKIISNFGN